MIFDFLRRGGRAPESAAYAIPPGQRVYAIGDVHGAFDQLLLDCALHGAGATFVRDRRIP